MNNNNFRNALAYEKEMMRDADRFYKEIFQTDGREIMIDRYDYDDPVVDKRLISRKMQRDGIDLKLTIKDKSGDVSYLNVSEKFRTADWGDMFIELYSRYPKVQGWGITGQDVDLIAYFTPEKAYFVNYEDIRNLASDILFTHNIGLYKDIKNDSFTHERNDKRHYIEQMVIPTVIDKKISWQGVGVTVSWEALKDWGIKYTEIDLKSTSEFDLE